MKTNLISITKEREFEPFKVVLTVESIKEARLLFHVFNSGKLKTYFIQDNHYNGDYNMMGCADSFSSDFWDIISNELESQHFEI